MSGTEFAIIDRYFARLGDFPSGRVPLGPGDDCAILNLSPGEQLCVSTDTLVEGVHFPVGASGGIVAHRSLVANLSDLAAMGAAPLGFVLALTLPRVDEGFLRAFSLRLGELVRTYDVPLVGGNLARGQLAVNITVFGTVPRGSWLARSGAAVGDDIYVSGTVGDAGEGLERWHDATDALARRYLFPVPRLALGQGLLDLASAAIDISDGVVADLGHICAASDVAATVMLDSVPVSAALSSSLGEHKARLAGLSSGDDYELCFTSSPSHREAIHRLGESLSLPLTKIGNIRAFDGGGRVSVVTGDGAKIELSREGYEHFDDP
ncbi:MAG: thiamine-phosphate kinase [Pseudomonadales bacterium]|nr:thiamine-phosphate kinase [Pseudomonadales bacterium]